MFQCSDASIVLILLLHDSSTADQRDDQLAANSMTARNYIEDMDLFIFNQDHVFIHVSSVWVLMNLEWFLADFEIFELFVRCFFLLGFQMMRTVCED